MNYEQKYHKYKAKYLALTNPMKGGSGKIETITIPNPKKLNKIGSFEVKDKLVIGEFDYEELKNMKKGIYNAYNVNGNLLVCHNSKNISTSNINKIKFTNNDNGVGVDGGTFGFFDLSTVNKIKDLEEKIKKNKPTKKKVKKNDRSLPLVNFTYKQDRDGKLVTINDIDTRVEINNKEPFGVMMTTGSGDGLLCCR